jgi:hypothetical protein
MKNEVRRERARAGRVTVDSGRNQALSELRVIDIPPVSGQAPMQQASRLFMSGYVWTKGHEDGMGPLVGGFSAQSYCSQSSHK